MPDRKPFPPPLPPRPIPREPFPKAKSDPPAPLPALLIEAIEELAPPTPRSPGTDETDPRDILIASMRQELGVLRQLQERPTTEPPAAPPTEPPPTRPSERLRRSKARVALLWSLAGLVLPALGAALARRWPELAEPIDFALSLVGQAPR